MSPSFYLLQVIVMCTDSRPDTRTLACYMCMCICISIFYYFNMEKKLSPLSLFPHYDTLEIPLQSFNIFKSLRNKSFMHKDLDRKKNTSAIKHFHFYFQVKIYLYSISKMLLAW